MSPRPGRTHQPWQPAGHVAASLVAAVAAIKTALAAGTGAVAVDILHTFADARDRLEFEAATLDSLGRTLLQRNQIDDALWCFVSLSRTGGDAAASKKGSSGSRKRPRGSGPGQGTSLHSLLSNHVPVLRRGRHKPPFLAAVVMEACNTPEKSMERSCRVRGLLCTDGP